MKKIIKFNTQKKYNYTQLYLFFNSMETLTNAGIPLLKTLEIIKNQAYDKKTIDKILDNLNNGDSLTDSMTKTNKFPDLSIDIINAAEQTGDLNIAFEKLKDYYIYMNDFKKNIYSTLSYPILLIFSVILLFFFINIYFIPSIIKIFPENVMETLPLITKINIQMSQILTEYKMEFFIIFLTFVYLILFIFSENFYTVVYKLPIIGEIIKLHQLSNMVWKYQLMMESGIDIISTTEMIIDRTKNPHIKNYLVNFLNSVRNGHSVTDSITLTGLKEENLIYFLHIGEETGSISGKLNVLNNIYIKSYQNKLKSLVNFIQPFIVIFITIIIAYILSTFILPILSLDYIEY